MKAVVPGHSRPTWVMAAVAAAAFALQGCASHSETLAPMRSALDRGDMRGAIKVLNEELDVKTEGDLPTDLGGDRPLMLLDRATIQQALVRFKASQTDYQAADKAIDLLDLSSNVADTIVEYMFSGSSSRYRAPPYEKLAINTLNMVNYLEQGDTAGGRIEARRLGVYVDYYRNKLKEQTTILALGGLLGGFILEKAGDADGALHYYDDALSVASFPALTTSVREALGRGAYRTPRLTKAAGSEPLPPPLEEGDLGDLLVVCGYGRVPPKVANRVPIGLALTYAAPFLSAGNLAQARELAARGAVTWVNYPSLGQEQGGLDAPKLAVDGQPKAIDEAVNVSEQVRAEWKRIEGGIMAAAITRMLTRTAVGVGAEAAGSAGGSDEARMVGFIAGLLAEATLTALDKPDTRSWETLPARFAVSRMRLPAGTHEVTISTRGMTRKQAVSIKKGGWATVSLFAIR